MSGVKKVVGYVEVGASACGISFVITGAAVIRRDVVTGRRVLVIHRVPAYALNGNPLDVVVKLLNLRVPVIIRTFESTTRSGAHWVSKSDVGILREIAPRELVSWADVEWIQDTPAGKIVYAANIEPIGHNEFEVQNTVFLSTLKRLVNEGKAELVEETEDYWVFKITDERVKKELIEHNICSSDGEVVKYKRKTAKGTIVIPLP